MIWIAIIIVGAAEVIDTLEELASRRVILERHPVQQGDVKRTSADTTLARTLLGWQPRMSLRDGLRSELEWARSHAEAQIPERRGRTVWRVRHSAERS